MTNKIVIIILISTGLIVLVLLSVFYINHRMKLADLNEKLTETIGKDQGLMEIILKIPGSEITYGEIFELCDKSVNDRIELIITLRGLYPNMKSDLKDSLIDFLSIENELVRDVKQYSRREMNIKGEVERVSKLRNNYNSDSYYAEYEYSTIQSGMKEIKDDAISALSSTLSFKEKYDDLVSKENNLSKQMAKAGLRFILIFDKYKTANIDGADGVIANCQKLLDN